MSVRPQKGEVSSVAIEICTDRLEISNPSDPTHQMTFLNTKPLRKVDIDRGLKYSLLQILNLMQTFNLTTNVNYPKDQIRNHPTDETCRD